MNWQDDAITKVPKKAPAVDSWWARPAVQENREAFQRQLVDSEIDRMNANKTFGGSKRVHDKFPQKRS